MTESHVVFRQARDGAYSVITIEDVRNEYDSLTANVSSTRARNAIRAGGLYCSHGASMTFVMGTKVNDHFRHVCGNNSRAGEAEATPEATPSHVCCECAGDDHLRAQQLLRDHNYENLNVIVTKFMSCKKHTKEVFCWAKNSSVRLEVSEVNDNGRRFVTDVAFFDNDTVVGRIEVLKTHKTVRGSRGSCTFFEIRADHILEAFRNALLSSDDVWLRAEGIDEDICEQCVAAAEAASMVEEEAITRQADKARLFAEKEAEQAKFRKLYVLVDGKGWMLRSEEARWRAEEEARLAKKEAEKALAKKEAEEAEQRAKKEVKQRITFIAAQRAKKKAQEARRRAQKEAEEAQKLAEMKRAARLLAQLILWSPSRWIFLIAGKLLIITEICQFYRLKWQTFCAPLMASVSTIGTKASINQLLKKLNISTPQELHNHFVYMWTNKTHWNFKHRSNRIVVAEIVVAEPPLKKQKTKDPNPNEARITDFFKRI